MSLDNVTTEHRMKLQSAVDAYLENGATEDEVVEEVTTPQPEGQPMTDAARIADATARYNASLHGVQTGVAYVMEKVSAPTSPKHLRVGVDSAMSTHKALAELLMAKGVFTEVEYIEALAKATEEERLAYEDRVNRLYAPGGAMKIVLS